MQILQGPSITEQGIRNRAFQQGVEQIGEGMSNFATAYKDKKKTDREMAFQLFDAQTKLAKDLGRELTPEETEGVRRLVVDGDSSTFQDQEVDGPPTQDGKKAVKKGPLTSLMKGIGEKAEENRRREQQRLDQESRRNMLENIKLEQQTDPDFQVNQKVKASKADPSSDQFKVGGFAKRVQQSEAVLEGLAQKGFDRTATEQRAFDHLPGEFSDENRLSQDQAERNFVNAILRRESGASISPAEFGNAEKQYFPRPGDTPQISAQKRANRLQAFESLKAEAGTAFEKIPYVETANKLSKEDQEAVNWAKKNPKDPRSAKILTLHGAK